MFSGSATPARLIELMPWVEISDGVPYLEGLLRAPISTVDILRLSLEGHLTLSVRFISPVTVQPGERVPLVPEMIERVPSLDGDGMTVIVAGTVLPGGDQVIRYEDRLARITDVWDLPMLGGERLFVERLYEQLNGRDPPDLINLEGTFVTDSAGRYFKVMERFGSEDRAARRKPNDPENFFPSAGLPDDAVLVLRPTRMREFAEKFSASQSPKLPHASKPLGSRERTTLLTIVAALAKMANLPIERTSKAAAIIEAQTELMGARVAARTIENHLKAIAEFDHEARS